MLFEHDIIVLTTHTVDAPLVTRIKLTKAVIHVFSVFFAAGCQHTVKVTVNRGSHQVYPLNPDGCIKGDNINVQGGVFTPILEEPYEVTVNTWNVGATYDHTITIRFWMKHLWQLMPFSDEMYALALKQEGGLPL